MRRWSAQEREHLAERLECSLAPAMGTLGIIFVFVVLGSTLAEAGSATSRWLELATWLLWVTFVVEFVTRLFLAPSRARFLKRNWWQLLFLLLPFLRFLRAAQLARSGRILSSTVRGSRSAGNVLRGRLGWLAATTAIVVLGSSQLLYALGEFQQYGDALYHAASTATTGNAMEGSSTTIRLAEILLGVYSVVVFATLAGMVGSFFVEHPSAEGRGRLRDAEPSAG